MAMVDVADPGSLPRDMADWLAMGYRRPADLARFYRRLRGEAPVLRWGDEIYLSRHADCLGVLRNSQDFLNGFDIEAPQHRAVFDALPADQRRKYREVLEHQLRWITSSNGAKHVALRTLATQVFSARAIDEMSARIDQEVETRLTAFEGRRSVEIIADVAYPLPLTIISEMLDIPIEVRESIHESWASMTRLVGQSSQPAPDAIDAAHAGMIELETRLRATMDLRRGSRTTDLLARLLEAQQGSDGAVSEREIIGIVSQMVIAGHQTTQDTIGNGLYELLRHRDQWRALCDQPDLVPNAVEEILRFRSPAQFMGRHVQTDSMVAGEPVARGERVVCMLGAANRDEALFDQPDDFDIFRKNAGRHIAFSSGAHFCLGAALSRLEVRSFLKSFSRRFPEARLASEDVELMPNLMLHGVTSLEVALH